jgi:hypothetical protein
MMSLRGEYPLCSIRAFARIPCGMDDDHAVSGHQTCCPIDVKRQEVVLSQSPAGSPRDRHALTILLFFRPRARPAPYTYVRNRFLASNFLTPETKSWKDENMTKTPILLLGFVVTSASLLQLGCEDPATPGTGGTGGSAGSESSSSSSSSSSGGGAGGSMAMTPAEKYCTAIMANCTGAEAQYADMKSCVNSANAFPPGTDADMTGDTLGCRAYHAGAAQGAPAMHCVHAGPAGGGAAFCGDTCQGFCDIAVATCKTEWPDKTTCMTACMALPTAVQNYNTSLASGNHVECRLYHATVAATDATSATAHCPHTKAVTAMGDPCF